ncbi:hypothetical protein BGW39_010736 [Mortierella sp. 14UC]|nr:hypothetical protein BGW39_010736 [Mortierella sp. 14UC]
MVATFPRSSTASKVLDSPTSTFSLLYFDTQGICNPIRNLLALGDAKWTQLYPQDWENADLKDKASTPFEVIPVLYVHSEDGSETVPIAESRAIEEYLASRFNRLGSNTYERTQILAFTASTSSLIDNFLGSVMHLQASPEITLADLKAGMLMDILLRFPQGAALLIPETAPSLLKLKAKIDADPKIKAWRATDLYKSQRASRAAPAAASRPDTIRLNDRLGNLSGGIASPPVAKED